MISIIVAVDRNNAIGLNNRLLCHLPNDLKYFKRVTSGHAVVMGRRTYESLPVKPLPNRENIIISKSLTAPAPGCVPVSSVEEACNHCNGAEEYFVIGGAQVYRQMMPMAQKLYITRIHHVFEADAWFPEINAGKWRQQSAEWNEPDEKHPYAYSFEVYTRIKQEKPHLTGKTDAHLGFGRLPK
ncbi:MAG: dihydrofolate reductase [Bacteroidales bacterium]|jgi:dihydrofolate reductase|nr:dihydrofolate reductase [Bacteroidales bacterium]